MRIATGEVKVRMGGWEEGGIRSQKAYVVVFVWDEVAICEEVEVIHDEGRRFYTSLKTLLGCVRGNGKGNSPFPWCHDSTSYTLQFSTRNFTACFFIRNYPAIVTERHLHHGYDS
jgi:hypothetical protein